MIAASSYAVYIPAAHAVKLSAPTEDITAGEFAAKPLSVNSISGGGKVIANFGVPYSGSFTVTFDMVVNSVIADNGGVITGNCSRITINAGDGKVGAYLAF